MKGLVTFFGVILSLNTFPQRIDTIRLKHNTRIAGVAQYICILGDEKRMVLQGNGKTHGFKEGLEDGMYTCYFDNKYQDTALVVTVENGKYNGLLKRWYNGVLIEECEYKNGIKNGWRKLYFHYPEWGGEFLNIYQYKNDKCIAFYTEW